MENTSNASEKKQASIVEFLIALIFIGVMMKLVISTYFNQEVNVTNAAFTGLAQNFTSKLNVVHGQWMMDEQPQFVVLSSLHSQEKQSIFVNDLGWIDSEYSTLACQNIWQQVLDMPLEVVNSPVTAIEIHNISIKNGRLCRYSIANGRSFDYRSDIGKVKQHY